MPFDWNEYLALARQLAAANDEASKRSAISRAYYFVFNIAFARAEATAGRFPGGETTHKWCWDRYERTPDPSCRRLGIRGTRMKRLRVKADYKATDIPRLDDEVRRMISEAQQFRANLDALNPRYPLP
jgi:hypothetical protein